MKNAVLARIDSEVKEYASKVTEAAKITRTIAPFQVGDTVDVHLRILEGEKERSQVFSGVVIGMKGVGANEAFTVRRIVQGEGVERVFPLYSPNIDSITVVRRGVVRRAKLYYLRGRTGKRARIAERKVTEAKA